MGKKTQKKTIYWATTFDGNVSESKGGNNIITRGYIYRKEKDGQLKRKEVVLPPTTNTDD